MTKKAVLLILVLALVPLFFLVNANDLTSLFKVSSSLLTQRLSVQDFGKKRIEYYKKPRKVIKFAALGAWRNWDRQNVQLKETLKFTVSKINAQQKKGSKHIEIIWYDTKGSAKTGDDLVDEIIAREDIFGVIGPFQSSLVSVIKNKLAAAHLLQITMTQGDIDLVVPRAKSYFSSTLSVFDEAQAIAKWGDQKFSKDAQFIIMHEDDLYSRKYAGAISRYFHSKNLNIIGSLNYEKKNTSGHVQRYIAESLKFAPNLSIISIGNRAMFLDFYTANEKFMDKLKYSDFIINQDSITWTELRLLPNIEKSHIILNYKIDEQLEKVMKELYYDGNIKTTFYIIPMVYRMVYTLHNAIDQAKSNDINIVLNYMNTQKIPTPLGDIAFNEHGYVKNYPVSIVNASKLYKFLKNVNIGIVE